VEHATEIWTKGALCVLALAVVLWRQRSASRLGERRAGQMLGLVALVAVAAYYNFGLFHGAGYVHYWEQFHYFLGSKYFSELGYDGLYVASLAAQQEALPDYPVQKNVRDLRTNQVAPTYAVVGQETEVRRRFSPARWKAFVADNRHFLEANRPDYIEHIRLDHGFNPSPTWTFVARLFDRTVPANRFSLTLLGLLDPLLLLVMFVVLFRTYGARVGCLALIIFGLGYPWRYDWVGGAFLRQDWLAATVIAICMLKRERYAAAGALFAYASMVRIFPVLFLFGPAVLGVRALVRREDRRWALRLGTGFAVGVVACLAAGGLAGRGVSAWQGFGRNLEKYEGTWLTNNVGLANLPLYERDTMERKLVDWSLPEPWSMWQAHMDRLKAERRPLLLVNAAVMLAVLGAAAWRGRRDEAAALGPAVVFALALATCYYWVMLVVLPLRRARFAVPAWLAVNVGLFALDLLTPAFEMIYGLMSWALAALFLVWTVPDALAIIRRTRAGG
jgi:hypothetical protein